MENLSAGVTVEGGKSNQVFAYFSPNGPAYFVEQPSTYYLSKLKLLRNLIIQQLSQKNADEVTFNLVLKELRQDQYISQILPDEVSGSISLTQLSIVLLEKHQSIEQACNDVILSFTEMLENLEHGRINCYREEDFILRPLRNINDILPSKEMSIVTKNNLQRKNFDAFISYSKEDILFKERLQKQLKQYERSGKLQLWNDRDIIAGQEWEKEIIEHLENDDLIFLLISPDFIATDYIWDVEVPKALERHRNQEATVIPIILRPCNWGKLDFSHIQALPEKGVPITKWTDQDDAWLAVEKGIEKVLTQF